MLTIPSAKRETLQTIFFVLTLHHLACATLFLWVVVNQSTTSIPLTFQILCFWIFVNGPLNLLVGLFAHKLQYAPHQWQKAHEITLAWNSGVTIGGAGFGIAILIWVSKYGFPNPLIIWCSVGT
jgi:hypothetical protein